MNSLLQFFFRQSKFLALATILLSTSSFAETFDKLPSEKKSEYFIRLNQQLPEVFFPRGGWYVNPAVVAQNESLFLEWLYQPENHRLIESEKPTGAQNFKIVADIETQELQMASSLQEVAAKKFEEYLQEMSSLSLTQAQQEALQIAKRLFGKSSGGLLTGLVQCLPAELKAQAFKLPIHEKIEFLESHLTDELISRSFRSTIYSKESLSKDFLINETKDLVSAEQRLGYLGLYWEWKKNNQNIQQVVQKWLTTPKDIFEGIEFGSQFTEAHKKKIMDSTSSAISSLLKPFIIQAERSAWTPTSRLVIESMPASEGIYRGSLNSDCFTTFAFGFVYAPSERTFIVRDGNGKFLFTVYAIVAELAGKKVLYVHEMGNSDISPEVGPQIMKALFASREKLGVDAIAIGSKSMHHFSFGNAIQSSAQDSLLLPLKFFDANSRQSIGNALVKITSSEYSKAHDTADAHKEARFYQPIEDSRSRLTAHLEPLPPKSKSTTPPSRLQILEMAIGLVANNNTEIIESLFPLEAAKKFVRILKNEDALPVLKFEAAAKEIMAELQLPWEDLEPKKAEQILQTGFILAPDGWSDANKDKSAVYMAHLIKGRLDHLDSIKLLRRFPQFYESLPFQKLLKSFLKDNPISLTKAQQLIAYLQPEHLNESTTALLLETIGFTNFPQLQDAVILLLQSPTLKIPSESERNFLKLSEVSAYNFLNILKGNPKLITSQMLVRVEALRQIPHYSLISQEVLELEKELHPHHAQKPLSCQKAG